MAQLKSQKEKLAEDLKELVKKSRKGSELATVESQIKGLENRLKYSQKDLESSKKAIQNYEKNLKDLENELNAISVSIYFQFYSQQRWKRIQTIDDSIQSVCITAVDRDHRTTYGTTQPNHWRNQTENEHGGG